MSLTGQDSGGKHTTTNYFCAQACNKGTIMPHKRTQQTILVYVAQVGCGDDWATTLVICTWTSTKKSAF